MLYKAKGTVSSVSHTEHKSVLFIVCILLWRLVRSPVLWSIGCNYMYLSTYLSITS
jgi:hypothetical protein